MKLSAIILTKDEETKIADCILSLNFCDEIIIIDNGSSDKTIEIARKFKPKIFLNNSRDFSALRNFAKHKAIGEWVLYVDADERIPIDLAKEILEAVKREDYDAFYITRNNFFFGKPWPHREKMIRLIRKKSLVGWQGSLHETAVVEGRTGNLINAFYHYTHDNLSKMLEKTNMWSENEARLRFEANHPKVNSLRIFRVMVTYFWNSYITKRGYKAGYAGILESVYQSFSAFVTYVKLWELQNAKNKK